MQSILLGCLLWFAAIGCGLLAGVYFAFSAFIMTALGRIDEARGIAAMQSINSTILRSLFLPLFLGTTIASAILAGMGLMNREPPGAIPMTAAGVIYVAGMFCCTMLFNVPLNNALDTDPTSVWTRYRKEWTRWNHVRTICSIAASALYTVAIQTMAC